MSVSPFFKNLSRIPVVVCTILCALLLLPLGLSGQAVSFNILVAQDDVLYYYASTQPGTLSAAKPDDMRMLQDAESWQAVHVGMPIYIKLLHKGDYKLMTYVLEQLRAAGLHPVQLATLGEADLAWLSAMPRLPLPPDAPPVDELVILLEGTRLCWYLTVNFPHIECGDFTVAELERILFDYDEHAVVAAFARNTRRQYASLLMATLDSLAIDLTGVRNLTAEERKVLGIQEDVVPDKEEEDDADSELDLKQKSRGWEDDDLEEDGTDEEEDESADEDELEK